MSNAFPGQQLEAGLSERESLESEVLPISLPSRVEQMLNFLPVKDNFGTWRINLPSLPVDPGDPNYKDILTIHHVYQTNKRADKYAFLALLLTDNQALNDYAGACGKTAENVLKEMRHKARNEGFPINPVTNMFDEHYLREQREKSSERAKKITESVVDLMRIVEDRKNGVEKFEPAFQRIKERYSQVDKNFDPKPSYGSENWHNWIKSRVDIFGGKIVSAADADLTLTTQADYLQFVPGSHHAESLLKSQTREVFPVVFVRYWQEALRRIPQVFERAGQRAEFRQGVWQFFKLSEEHHQPIVIMSANFKPIIKGMLQRLPHKRIQSVYSVSAHDISATDKKTVLKEIVANNPDRAVFIFEDGHSGLPLTDDDISGLVGCYFALEGSEFHEELKKKNLPYYSFKDFNENINHLLRFGVFRQS